MSDWKELAALAAEKIKAAEAAEAPLNDLKEAARVAVEAYRAAIDAAKKARAEAIEVDQAAIIAEVHASPDEPVAKNVNGLHVRLSSEERAAIKAEWAANEARRVAAEEAADEEAKKPSLESLVAQLAAKVDALASRK